MADNNQELIKKDLVYIIQLNAKVHYNNVAEVQQARNLAIQRRLFKTTLGQRYMRRLEQIIQGTNVEDKCVLCGNDLDNTSLVCLTCMTKYKLTPTKKENTNATPRQENNTNRKISTASGQTDAAQQAVYREQGIAARPKAKTKKKLSKKTIIIALAVMVFIGGLISEDGGTSSNDLINMMEMTESQAEKKYGEPDRVDRNNLGICQGFYNEGFWYITDLDGYISMVQLTRGTRELAGISIGDSDKEVTAAMKERGGVFSGEFATTSNGQQILQRTYEMKDYVILVDFDLYNATVVDVAAIP